MLRVAPASVQADGEDGMGNPFSTFLPIPGFLSRHPAFWGWACRFTPPPFVACLVREGNHTYEEIAFFFPSVRVQAFVCTCTWRPEGVCTCTWRPEDNLGCWSSGAAHAGFVFGIGSPWRLSHRLDWLASEVQGPTYSTSPTVSFQVLPLHPDLFLDTG